MNKNKKQIAFPYRGEQNILLKILIKDILCCFFFNKLGWS